MMIIKLGGTVFENVENICRDLIKLDDKIVVVHGGAKEVTEIAEKLGKKQRFVVSPDGVRSRYTDEETVGIFQMVLAGKINKDIVRYIVKYGKKAVGLCGIDNLLVRAKRKKWIKIVEDGKTKLFEGGYTGKVFEINKNFLETLFSSKIIPVIASVAIGEEYESLNTDADSLASFIASALGADTMILFTDKNGVLDEKNSTIPKISRENYDDVMKKIGFGMNRKVLMCKEALEKGVKKIIIANGLVENPIENALSRKDCTVIE